MVAGYFYSCGVCVELVTRFLESANVRVCCGLTFCSVVCATKHREEKHG